MKGRGWLGGFLAGVLACTDSSEGERPSKAGAADAGPDSSELPDACRASRRGVLELTVASAPEAPRSTAVVRFEQTLLAPSPVCSTETFEACTVRRCTPAPTSDAKPPCPGALLSAGAVTISGGTTPLEIAPDASGGYAGLDEPGARWSGGNALVVTASGDVVPAFGTSIEFPSVVDLATSDPLRGTEPIDVSQAQGFASSWTPGLGRIELVLEASTGSAETLTLRCRFPSQAGRGTIPPAAVAKLPLAAGAGGASSGTLRFRNMNENDVRAGDFAIRVTAQAPLADRTFRVVL